MFDYFNDQTLPLPFTIYTGKTPDNKPKFNQVKLVLTPINQTSMLIDITVTVDGLERKVVNGLKYDGKLNYKKGTTAPVNLNKSIPQTFKVGFAASTGSYFMTHIISSIDIDLLNAAEPEPDFGELNGYTGFDSSNKKVEIDVFNNDKFFRGDVLKPSSVSDKTFIDSNTFEFEFEKGIAFENSTNPMQHIDSGVGEWTFDPETRLVTFKLTKADAKDGDTFTVNYSAKGFNTDGGPFGDDPYRSKTTSITVTYRTKEASFRINPNNTLEFKK